MYLVKNEPTVSIIPLGGLGEIGKNMYIVKYDKEILVIDSGLIFPGEEMLGIDIVIPDITYLKENKDCIKGIVLTHGHEDHIGALPYILQEIDAPVYGTKLTLGLVEGKLKENKIRRNVELNIITPPNSVDIGNFQVEFIRVNHSIPDSVGLAIHTPAGIIVTTGDFKIDQTPVDGQITDIHKFAELGKKGVLVMMSDSTNSEHEGYTLSEKVVGSTIEQIFRTTKGRIIVATFASNIHRIQQLFTAAEESGRKVGIVGRSMVNVVSIAIELGYLKVQDDTILDMMKLTNYR